MAPRFVGPIFSATVAVLASALAAAVVLALLNLKPIAGVRSVDIAVPNAAIHVDGSVVHGTVRDGLPMYRLHWDGQPPSAVLIDARSGETLAAGAFSDESFARSRDAVRFTAGEARFVLDARRWTPGRSLVVRCEMVPSRGRYYAAALAALALGAVILVLFAVRCWSATAADERPALRRAFVESALFLLIAAATFAAIYPGAPVRISDISDEANLNSFAAAVDHPERFRRDAVLSEPANFDWYIPAYIGLIRSGGRLGFHYETVHAFLAAAIALALLFGLRRLFQAVSGHRGFALAAALALALMNEENLPAGESWNLLGALPRAMFTAATPWVLLLAIRCAPSSRRWWMGAGAAGLLMHLYPLSTPALVAALLAAFFVGSDEPMKARLEGAALAAAAAALAMLPYVIVYTARYQRTVDPDPAIGARAMQIVRATWAGLDARSVLWSVATFRAQSFRFLLDGLALVLVLRRPFDRRMRFYLGLAAGFVTIVFLVPWLDGVVAAQLGRRPYQTELVRNIRFLDLFLFGALAIGVREGWPAGRTGRAVAAAGVVCAALSFGPGWVVTAHAMAGRSRLSWRILHGRPDRPTAAAQEAVRAIQALRRSEERVVGPVGLRQFDVPLGWVSKDAILLTSGPSRALVSCTAALDRARPLRSRPLDERALSELARIFDAQLFFLPRDEVGAALASSSRVLFQNDVWSIVSARSLPTPADPGDRGVSLRAEDTAH